MGGNHRGAESHLVSPLTVTSNCGMLGSPHGAVNQLDHEGVLSPQPSSATCCVPTSRTSVWPRNARRVKPSQTYVTRHGSSRQYPYQAAAHVPKSAMAINANRALKSSCAEAVDTPPTTAVAAPIAVHESATKPAYRRSGLSTTRAPASSIFITPQRSHVDSGSASVPAYLNYMSASDSAQVSISGISAWRGVADRPPGTRDTHCAYWSPRHERRRHRPVPDAAFCRHRVCIWSRLAIERVETSAGLTSGASSKSILNPSESR